MKNDGPIRVARGFTLVELVVVAMIIAIYAAIAIPHFSQVLTRQRVEAAARRMVADLQLAKQRAKITGAPVTVRFASSNTYELSGMRNPDNPANPYVVELGEDPYGVEKVTADFGGSDEITFDLYGMPDSGGSIVIRVGSQFDTVLVDPNTGKASVQ